jgi:hypothetical protein
MHVSRASNTQATDTNVAAAPFTATKSLAVNVSDLSVAADSGTNDADYTATYAMLSWTAVQGNWIVVHVRAMKGITAGVRTTTVVFQIGATTVITVATAAGTAASTVDATYFLVRNPKTATWRSVAMT